ncbi:MAG: Histidine kinase [Fibrobacteres bacterium]|nr:Histidine kinase [Fibrobacterota bacterium]
MGSDMTIGSTTEALKSQPEQSEKMARERNLRQSEERYRRLFETAQDGILILDGEGGHIEDVNPFLLEFLGYSRDELLGKELWEIGLFQDIEANRKAFRTLKEKGFIRYEDLPLKTKQGLSREVEFVSNTYRVGDKGVIQCNIRDITPRKQAEKALHLSEEALRQSKKMEAMGKLSGGIAHDFNNLLTAVNGYAGMALSMVEPEGTVHDFLTEILKAGDRATALTKQLLAFSRQQILAPKVLGLNSIVSEMHVMLARLIGETMHLREDLDPALGRVKADLVQMQQILMNLVINARDAMPNGGDITIMTRNSGLDAEYLARHPGTTLNDFVMLSVRDLGIGMDADVKARIFDPFFTTKEFGKGTGMGLATVHGIVEQSGGHIEVESSPGKGSTFRIYLPRTEKEEERPIIAPAVDNIGGKGSETVLLAEDEAMVSTVIRKALEMFGYTVLEAENGSVALTLCQTHEGPIDVLLTDLMMPSMNGRELAQSFIRLRPEGSVLFMSGYTDDIIAQQGMIEEGDRFIQKPFSPARLAKAVREVLEKNMSKLV